MNKKYRIVFVDDEIGWSTCDVCNKYGNFFDGYFTDLMDLHKKN